MEGGTADAQARVLRLWRAWEVCGAQRMSANERGMPLGATELRAEADSALGLLGECARLDDALYRASGGVSSGEARVGAAVQHAPLCQCAGERLAACWAELERAKAELEGEPQQSQQESSPQSQRYLRYDAIAAAVDSFVRRTSANARKLHEWAVNNPIMTPRKELVFDDEETPKQQQHQATSQETRQQQQQQPQAATRKLQAPPPGRRFDPASSIVRALNEKRPAKRTARSNDDAEDDEEEEPRRTHTDFMTAGEKLARDEAIKNGCKPPPPKSSSSTSRKFVAPFRQDDDEEDEAPKKKRAKTAEPKSTGGEDGGCTLTDINGVPLDDPRLKGIEPFLLERVNDEVLDHSPSIRWADIAGLDFAKKCVQEAVVWPMLRPDIFHGLRGPPKGLLLFGPPGTGKTMIGKAIASESQSTFFNISASSLTSKWIGEGEKTVRALFAVAKCYPRSVIFIDEIDSILTQRSDGENEASRRLKTEFLIQLDGAGTGADDRVHILVVGATNRPQELDEAARRRLAKRLYIALPDHAARVYMLKKLLSTVDNDLTPEQFDEMGRRTEGYSGSDISDLCKDAALGPIRDLEARQQQQIAAAAPGSEAAAAAAAESLIATVDIAAVRPVNLRDLIDALSHVRASVSKADLEQHLEWNKHFGSFPGAANA